MVQVTLEEAATRLPQLVAQAEAGEEVWLTTHTGSIVRLTALTQNGSKDDTPRPRFGSAKGMVWMAPDFDEPLEDFKEYME